MALEILEKWVHRLKWTWFTRTGAKNVAIDTKLGFKFIVELNSGSAFLFYFDKYEIEEINLIEKYVKSNMSVLDIGANMGYMSLLMAKLVGPHGKLYSFEPNPHMYSRLNENIKLNPNIDDGRISAEKIALGSSKGKMNFYCPIEGHEGVGGLQDTKRAPLDKVIEVDVSTLDEYVSKNNIDQIDFIKMDVEGGEFDVIRGGIETLKKMKPIILFEATDLNAASYGYVVKEFLKFIENQGYTITAADSENYIAIPPDR